MTFVLDTNVVSGLRRRDRLPRTVLNWFEREAEAEMFISVITLMELEVGIRRLERVDDTQGALLRRWKSERVEKEFSGLVLSVDGAIAECCASLHVPDPRSPLDALIAATAIVHRKTPVTRNVSDFRGMPVSLVDPWDPHAM